MTKFSKQLHNKNTVSGRSAADMEVRTLLSVLFVKFNVWQFNFPAPLTEFYCTVPITKHYNLSQNQRARHQCAPRNDIISSLKGPSESQHLVMSLAAVSLVGRKNETIVVKVEKKLYQNPPGWRSSTNF
jgi:hypothetical protein